MSPPLQTHPLKDYTVKTRTHVYRLVCAKCGRKSFGSLRQLALFPCACGAVACGAVRRIVGSLRIQLDCRSQTARSAMLRAISAERTRNATADQGHAATTRAETPATPRMCMRAISGENAGTPSRCDTLTTAPASKATAGGIAGWGVCPIHVPAHDHDRDQWAADLAPEIVALCHEGAARRAQVTGAFHGIHRPHAEAERMSKDYIEDRLRTDDPLEGYAIRANDAHRQMLGFIFFTTFTTWTRSFRWDSKSPDAALCGASGTRSEHARVRWDEDNSLAQELEKQDRTGDPEGTGVIWKSVGEISLAGSLVGGGGRVLMQRVLEDMKQKGYRYAVVQATESSAGFYDRCGFTQVGALARYGADATCDVAYRHWTFPDQDVLDIDASIMMALRLSEMHTHPGTSSPGRKRPQPATVGAKSATKNRRRQGNVKASRKREVVKEYRGVMCPEFKGGLWKKTNSLKVLLDGLASKGLVRPHARCLPNCDRGCPAQSQAFPFFRVNGQEFSHLEVVDPHRVYDFLCGYIKASPLFRSPDGRPSERPDGRVYNLFNDLGFLSRACAFRPAEGIKGKKDLYYWDSTTWNDNKARRSTCNARKRADTQPELILEKTETFPAHLYNFDEASLSLSGDEEKALVLDMIDSL